MGYIREVEISAPLERVWRAWTSRIELQGWLAPSATVEFFEGGAYELFWGRDPDRDSTRGCRLVTIVPRERIVFEWRGVGQFQDLFASSEHTLVEVRFAAATPSRTLVVLEQRETRAVPGWAAYDEWMADAWEEALLRLGRYCQGEDVLSSRDMSLGAAE